MKRIWDTVATIVITLFAVKLTIEMVFALVAPYSSVLVVTVVLMAFIRWQRR